MLMLARSVSNTEVGALDSKTEPAGGNYTLVCTAQSSRYMLHVVCIWYVVSILCLEHLLRHRLGKAARSGGYGCM